MRAIYLRVVVFLFLAVFALGARGQSVDCANPTSVIPDGRLNGSSIPAGTVFWFGLSTSQALASYAVEADFPKGAATMPLLGVFAASDITPGPCTGSSSVTTRDIKALTPEAPNGRRLSFSKTTPGAASFLLRVENPGGASQALTLRVTETTMFSSAWSTFGQFNTFYSFVNTINGSIDLTLKLFDTAGVEVGSANLAVPAGQTLATNTVTLGTTRNKNGSALLVHNGPAGGLLVEAAIANFAVPPGVVQPVKFQELRAAGPSASALEMAGGGGGGVNSVAAGDASITIGGTMTNPTVAVTDGGVTNAKLALNSVATGNLQNTSVTAAKLADGSYWRLAGNAGTTPGTNFLGTTDNVALEFRVNNLRALRIEPAVAPNLIGGFNGNSVTGGVNGATISGGGASSLTNRVTDNFGTVAGGRNNQAGNGDGIFSLGDFTTVGGGVSNTASGDEATVGGGDNNTASGPNSTVGGGISNTASGFDSTVPGGVNNSAVGNFSFAAGRRAKANHAGAFVWGDSTDADIASTADNQFIIRASGGVGIGTTSPANLLHVLSSGGQLARLETTTNAVNPVLELFDNSPGQQRSAAINFLTQGGTPGQIAYQVDTNAMSFRTNSVERMFIGSTGNVGIGNSPFGNATLRVSRANVVTTGTQGMVVENFDTNTTTDGSFRTGLRVESTGTFTGGGGVANINRGLFVIADGADTNRAAEFQSTGVAGHFNRASDGVVIEIASGGTVQGDISVSGPTVSYNAFTGSHYGWTNEPIDRGMLVRFTGENKSSHDRPGGEPIYGVALSARANDPAILGAYLGRQEPGKPDEPVTENPHLVMAVGNGEMWVVDTGEDIQPGDALISSETPGHAMKDSDRFVVSYVVARAAERVRWNEVAEPVNGVKHKRISVLFDSHVREKATALAAEVSALRALLAEQAAELAELRAALHITLAQK